MKTIQEWMENINQKADARMRAMNVKKRAARLGISAAGVSLAIVLTLNFILPLFENETPAAKIPVSGEKTPVDPEPVLSTEIPDWYKPGNINVTALLSRPADSAVSPVSAVSALTFPRVAPLSAVTPVTEARNTETYITLPESTTAATGGNTSRDVDFVQLDCAPEYPGGFGIYYNIPEDRVFCFSSIIEEKSREANVWHKDDILDLYYCDPLTGNSIFRLQRSSGKTRGIYFCNIYDGRFLDFPVTMNGDEHYEAAGGPERQYYAVVEHDPGKNGKMHLIDMSQNHLKAVDVANRADVRLDAAAGPAFSDDGKYLYYKYANNEGGSYTDRFGNVALYSIQNKTTILFDGTIERFIGDRVIVSVGGDGMVLDCETGLDVTEQTELEEWQKYEVRKSYFRSGNIISIIPMFGNGEERIIARKVNALPCDEYIYMYTPGDSFIVCRQIAGDEAFMIPLDEEFVHEIKSVDTSRMNIYYYMVISPEKTKLRLLTCITERSEYDFVAPEFCVEEISILFRSASCLEDLKDYFDKCRSSVRHYIGVEVHDAMFDLYGYLSFVEGDGYTAAIILTESNPAATFVAVEDYRDQSFTLYRQDSVPWLTPPMIYAGEYEAANIGIKPYRKPLAARANSERARKLFAGMEPLEPYYDYVDFYTDGKLDEEKAEKWWLRQEIAHTAVEIKIFNFNDMKRYDKKTTYYEYRTVIDREAAAKLLKTLEKIDDYFSSEKGYKIGYPSFENPNLNHLGKLDYLVQFHCFTYIERYTLYNVQLMRLNDGKYLVHTDAGFAYVSAELYSELAAICKNLYGNALPDGVQF